MNDPWFQTLFAERIGGSSAFSSFSGNVQQPASFLVARFQWKEYAEVGPKPDRQRRERLPEGHGIVPQVQKRPHIGRFARAEGDRVQVRRRRAELRVVAVD